MQFRIFVKKTRRGNILKIVREHYLRDDLSCGSEMCESLVCRGESTEADQTKVKLVLESLPISNSSLFQFPHYLIPDTNIILHQVKLCSIFHIYQSNQIFNLFRWM